MVEDVRYPGAGQKGQPGHRGLLAGAEQPGAGVPHLHQAPEIVDYLFSIRIYSAETVFIDGECDKT